VRDCRWLPPHRVARRCVLRRRRLNQSRHNDDRRKSNNLQR
jgi:hypothetical protein